MTESTVTVHELPTECDGSGIVSTTDDFGLTFLDECPGCECCQGIEFDMGGRKTGEC